MDTKSQLLMAIATSNRGLLTRPEESLGIASLVTQLEGRNPTPAPTGRPDLLDGCWRLLYTTSLDVLGLGRLPGVTLGQVYQVVQSGQGLLYNVAELSGLPLLDSVLSVRARLQAVDNRRLTVKFEMSMAALQRLVNYSGPTAWVAALEASSTLPIARIPLDSQRPAAWLDVTYLDEDLRISRGDRGNLFILGRA